MENVLCLQHCKHLYLWGRITQTICIPSKIPKIWQWNRCSTYLRDWISDQSDEIYGVKTINWEDSSWKYLSLIVWWTRHQSPAHKKSVRILRFCIVSWKDEREAQSNTAWEQRLAWFKSSPEYRNFDRIDGEPMEFEWNIFPGYNTLQLNQEVKSLLLRLGETPENFTGRIIFMSMFNDISCGSRRQWKRMRVECSTRFSTCKKIWNRIMVISWSWFREKVSILSVQIVHKVNGTELPRRWC